MPANVILPQSGAKRITRVIEETALGVTPVGAWDLLRNTGGNGASADYQTEESEELGSDQLGISGLTRVDTLGNFEYPFEYSNSALFDLMLESLFESSFIADTMVPGSAVKTFTVEDEFAGVRETQFIRGARCTGFNLTIESGTTVKGTLTGEGADVGVGAARSIAVAADIDFIAPDIIDSTNVTDPWAAENVAVGDYVLVEGAATPANDGYYKIIALPSAGQVQVDGIIAADTADSPTLTVNPRTLVAETSGTENPKDTSPIFRAGTNVSVTLDGVDVLNFGLRIPQLEINITTPSERARDITEDSPYLTLLNDRQVEVTFQWHVINLEMLRNLEADGEHALVIVVGNGTHSRTFTLPRAKFAEGAPGGAGRGVAIMTGSSRMVGLLNASNVNIQVDRDNT